ncbi:hypothetical protein ACIGO9_31760 [Nocardia asteroides]|uniref:hypothetical protein n=1 Tax=Nocardia asteroides TaxID=1824 RepID=UPI0037CC9D80
MGSLEDEIQRQRDARSRATSERAAEQAAGEAHAAQLTNEFIALMTKHRIPPVPLFVEKLDRKTDKGTRWRPDIQEFRYTYVADMWIMHFPGDRNTAPSDRAVRCDGGPTGCPCPQAIPQVGTGHELHYRPSSPGMQGPQDRRRTITRVHLDPRAEAYAARYDNHLWVTQPHLLKPASAPLTDLAKQAYAESLAQTATRLIDARRCTTANHKLRR